MTSRITSTLVSKLIAEQFPEYVHLPIRPVKNGGIDNRTLHLGDEMLIRLPSTEEYILQVPKEQKWLPILAKHLSIPIPAPIALGRPSKDYPWNWSIYKWLDGESANNLSLDDKDLEQIAIDLAGFLRELHKIDLGDGPIPGNHNFLRGNHPSIYDADMRLYLQNLRGIIDTDKATALWEKAIDSRWEKGPAWIHGDFASGNFLIKDRRLSAVIDFGGTGIGDPACDLVIAWTFLRGKSRDVFKKAMDLDEDTWNRARAWAVWKACFEITELEDRKGLKALRQIKIIEDILSESE